VIGQQLHANLRASAGRERQQVGPFLATFTPGTTHPSRNYAVPDDDISPTPAEIAALVGVFQERRLRPRLEYSTGAAPALEQRLVVAGFSVEARLPVWVYRRAERAPLSLPPGFIVADAVSDDDHRDAIMVANEAYGEAIGKPTRHHLDARHDIVRRGGAVAIARVLETGAPVASGLYPIPQSAVTEVAAVGVIPAYRGHGLAAAVILHLATRAIDHGVDLVWLTAEHDLEATAAATAGFSNSDSEMIHISL
jgi:GNAT superfamily N-acetyltransferase